MGKQGTAIDFDPKLGSQPSQSAVYRTYRYMQANAAGRFHNPAGDNLAGRLIVCAGFGTEGAELALASTIAGGAFLGIDSSSEHLKAAVRNGCCDFMVNTLDESLRVLKNELRKQTALSVGLLGLASEIFPAMVERGVQPDLIAERLPQRSEDDVAIPRQSLLQLLERGAWNLDARPIDVAQHAAPIEVVWTTANAADLKRLDTVALALLPEDDRVRRRWLLQAPGCFHRQIPLRRVLGLEPEELNRLLSSFQDEASTGRLQAPASVCWESSNGAEQTVTLQPC
ncbi:MAG: hypothetical protein RB191_01655 [Terriglobia bacterium]|nr:hypothetical protein [Terriglobia bacterium]